MQTPPAKLASELLFFLKKLLKTSFLKIWECPHPLYKKGPGGRDIKKSLTLRKERWIQNN